MRAQLKGAVLFDANLTGSSFEAAELTDADLGGATMPLANLDESKLEPLTIDRFEAKR